MPPGRAPDGYATPAFRWLVRLVAVSAMVLIPWAAYLADTLPPSVSARHWPLAWTGLDIAMAAGLGATGWLAIRRDRWLAVPAVSTATLMAADAWFDVCTAPAGRPLAVALADTCVELAEAAACLALAFAIWREAPVARWTASPAEAAGDPPDARRRRGFRRHRGCRCLVVHRFRALPVYAAQAP
jgi:hypothetical protein